MPLLCRLGFHKPMPSKLWNDGHFFSVCTRCRKDLIREALGKWKEVPANMRVVWRPRTPDDIQWPTSLL